MKNLDDTRMWLTFWATLRMLTICLYAYHLVINKNFTQFDSFNLSTIIAYYFY